MDLKFRVVVLCALLIFGFANTAKAEGWVDVKTQDGLDLNCADYESGVIVAAGELGTVVTTADNGKTWSKKQTGIGNNLFGVAFSNKLKIVAVGAGGMIIRSTDSGATWAKVFPTGLSSSETISDLHSIIFASSSIGYAVGEQSLVLKTTNSGETWSKIASPNSETVSDLNDITSVSASKLWVVGDGGAIVYSSNSGKSWTVKNSGTQNNLNSIVFTDSKHGFVAGDNRTLLRTDNAGASWSAVKISGLATDEAINDIVFESKTVGMLVGESGTVLETDDGGATWSLAPSSAPVELRALLIAKDNSFGFASEGAVYLYDSSEPSKPLNFDVEGENNSVSDSTPTFTWDDAKDDTAIDYYKFRMDDGVYENVGENTTFTYDTKLTSGKHTARVFAVDEAGNEGSVSSLTFTVSVGAVSKGTSSKVGRVGPATAVIGKNVNFSAVITSSEQVVS
jgi:photosystem II stability/assembly factor-like uncharacterized protein